MIEQLIREANLHCAVEFVRGSMKTLLTTKYVYRLAPGYFPSQFILSRPI